MNLAEEIQGAIKSNNAIIGYRESIKFIKNSSPKIVIIANNTPNEVKKNIENNSKISNIKIEIFNGNSKELGVLCGKPFPVSVLVIRG